MLEQLLNMMHKLAEWAAICHLQTDQIVQLINPYIKPRSRKAYNESYTSYKASSAKSHKNETTRNTRNRKLSKKDEKNGAKLPCEKSTSMLNVMHKCITIDKYWHHSQAQQLKLKLENNWLKN